MTERLSDEQLQAIEARWAAVTPGRWGMECDRTALDRPLCVAAVRPFRLVCVLKGIEEDAGGLEQVRANGTAIYHAPRDVSALLAEVKRLRALELPWTNEEPTVPGRYWARILFVSGSEPFDEIVRVRNPAARFAYALELTRSIDFDRIILWAGPIPEPKP